MKNLKLLREKNDLTQASLAKILKISPSTIAMYERGERKPDPDMIIKISNYFNISTDYLLGRDEPIQKQKNLSPTQERLLKKITNFSDEEILEIEKFMDYMQARKEMDNKSTTA